jgi:IclR family transcriptional regulator, pca regulon regulatory protein
LTRVIERIGRILGAFTLEHPQMTLTTCAQTAELNKSSAYRLLLSLEEIGLVERQDSLWRLGPNVVSLATVRLGRLDLRQEAVAHLRDLRRMFQAAVAFSVPEGSDMIYLERFDSPDAFGVSARLGARAAMWSAASGKAVLACMAPHERDARLDVEAWRRLPRSVRDRVLAEVEEAERRGFSIDTGEFYNGIAGIAIAIRDTHGDPVAAVTAIVPNERLVGDFTDVVGSQLREVADKLELFLGNNVGPDGTTTLAAP